MWRVLHVRWLRRYKGFMLAAGVLLAFQLILAFNFTIDSNNESSGHQLSATLTEVVEERDGGESSRRFRENYPGLDDEDDGPENSNPFRVKINIPPDKSPFPRPPPKKTPLSPPSKTRIKGLRTEELDFAPMCEVTTREAVSAVQRARSQHCKQMIVNTTCLIASGDLFPPSLPHNCPAPGLVRGRLLGCYQDDKSRLLPSLYTNLKANNSASACISLCLQSGFSYAGVQYRTECFCGDEEPRVSARLPDSSCNMKCPGDPRQPCGGYYTINIYQTGVARWSSQVPREGTGVGQEPPVRIVYLLSLNGRAVRQVHRLIKALFHRDHYFYIHIDARQDYMLRELSSLEVRLSNVRLSRRRHATIWGGSSLLVMLLDALHELSHSAWQWDFVINLSETDYPIKRNKDLVEFLSANRGLNFVKSHGHEAARFIQKQGLDKAFVECDAHMWRIGERSLPDGIVVDGGSDWLALSRQFVYYLTSPPLDTLVSGLITVFRHTLLPAESFFHTVLRNCALCETYVDNNLHVTNWRRRLGCRCQYRHIVDWCGCSPNNFKPSDWTRLQSSESRQVYFARKFEPIISQQVINQLDEWLYGPYPSNLSGLESYWESVYDEADLSPTGEDALTTLGHSVARLTAKRLAVATPSCPHLTPTKLLSLTSYHHQDSYMGTLVLFEASDKETTSRLEAWIKPLDTFTVVTNSTLPHTFTRMTVSSDFDQKEELSRNRLRCVGPYSDVVAVVEGTWLGPPTNVSVLWVDPTARLADSTLLALDDTATVSFSKGGMKSPLLPGVWTAAIVYNGTVVARASFLITPLQHINNSPLSIQQAEFVHGGPTDRYRAGEESSAVLQSLGVGSNSRQLYRKAMANSRRVGRDLLLWIDQLTSRFYKVEDVCLVGGTGSARCALEVCSSTHWSSLSPDPKSNIVSIDKTSGLINRW